MSLDIALSQEALDKLMRSHVGALTFKLFFFIVGNMNENYVVLLSQKDIAERLDCSLCSVNKSLASLRRLRFIKSGNKCIEICRHVVTFDIPKEEKNGC
jgi:hypothetical protein